MITQNEAEQLLADAKEAARKEILSWQESKRYDEPVVSVQSVDLEFLLTFTRNPFEVKAHFRTKKSNIQLARIDTQRQHHNPDGKIIHGPHLHWYREGYHNLEWAEEIDWYDANKPVETLFIFLDLIKTRFPNGFQQALL